MHTTTCPSLKGVSPEELDELFLEIVGKKNSPKSLKFCRGVYDRVMAGAVFLSANYTGWWKKVEIGEIDLGKPTKSPYNLVPERFGISSVGRLNISLESAIAMGFFPKVMDDPHELVFLNRFWNEMIAFLQAHPVLELAVF